MSDIFSLPPIFHSSLSHFKLLFLHTKYVFRNRSHGCYDNTLALTVTSLNSQGVLMLHTDLRIGVVIYKFVSYNIPTFWLFALNGFNYRSYIENISHVKQCDNLGLSLHFVPSLHFKPNLQSAVCILYLLTVKW